LPDSVSFAFRIAVDLRGRTFANTLSDRWSATGPDDRASRRFRWVPRGAASPARQLSWGRLGNGRAAARTIVPEKRVLRIVDSGTVAVPP
jgi:hypothetical protein